MAIKALMLRKKIDMKSKELEELRKKSEDFQQRESDLEKAIDEAETDEENDAVEAEIEKLEAEKAEHDAQVAAAESDLRAIEDELAKLESEDVAAAQRAADAAGERKDAPAERNEVRSMDKREFFGMNVMERDAFFSREDVTEYLGAVRSCIREKRALTNVGLTIPSVFIGLLKQTIDTYSKLYKHLFVRQLGGDGRLVVQGSVPEAVWTDCCANLNELDLVFNDTEINCWKVGGFFAVCNAVLEDSDVDLATELVTALGKAIGLALDKAVLYGTGSRMPLGVMTRLAQTSEPADYQATERPWVDLHESNIVSVANTFADKALFKEIVLAAGNAKGDYASGGRTWAMNEKTMSQLVANAMSINSAGAIVTGINGTMPVIGGSVEILNFIPDNVIIGGYFENYLLGERAGEKFATSEHYRFLSDQTVFKGTARYDGKPVIAEAFVAIGLNGTTPGASMTFAPDKANTVQNIVLNKGAAEVVVGETVTIEATTQPVDGAVTWATSDATKATVANGVVTGVAAGTAVITAASGDATAACTVTVVSGG